MIDLHGMGSPNVLKVVFALEELALPYRFHFVNVFLGEQFSPEFLRLNPNSKVPVIVDDDGPGGRPITLFESGAILLYLAEKTGMLLSRDAATRAVEQQWLMFQMASIGPMFGQNVHFSRFAPPGNDYARSRYATEVERVCDVVETRLAQARFLGGDAFSVADVAAWPWLRMLPPAEAGKPSRPALRRWIDAVGERTGAKAMVEFRARLPVTDFRKLAEQNPDELDRYFGRGRYARA